MVLGNTAFHVLKRFFGDLCRTSGALTAFP
jgi:hypothetical protein